MSNLPDASERPSGRVGTHRGRGVAAHHVLYAAIAYLLIGWLLFFAVDVFNVVGTRDRLAGLLHEPMTWFHLFNEGRLTEWLQWLLLGIAGLIAAVHAGRLWDDGADESRRLRVFWVLIALALTLMLIEDAGNVRHMLRGYAFRLTGTSLGDRAAEFAFFTVLAGIPLYALARYWTSIRRHPQTFHYLLAAFAFYGVAGLSSATRHWWDWHDRLGGALLAGLRRLDENFIAYEEMGRPGYWLMDMIVEESIELMGAALFLCAMLAFAAGIRRAADDRRTHT